MKKVHISVTFLLITFFWCIFFALILALFLDFDCKCAGNGSKKRKIVFYECVLEFNYATIKGFALPSCKNRCTLVGMIKPSLPTLPTSPTLPTLPTFQNSLKHRTQNICSKQSWPFYCRPKFRRRTQ